MERPVESKTQAAKLGEGRFSSRSRRCLALNQGEGCLTDTAEGIGPARLLVGRQLPAGALGVTGQALSCVRDPVCHLQMKRGAVGVGQTRRPCISKRSSSLVDSKAKGEVERQALACEGCSTGRALF